jgi:hypothetical protein
MVVKNLEPFQIPARYSPAPVVRRVDLAWRNDRNFPGISTFNSIGVQGFHSEKIVFIVAQSSEADDRDLGADVNW